MRRVTRPGGLVVVADESPRLHRAGLGHLIGVPAFDAWWLRQLGLDRDFVDDGARFRCRPSRAVPARLARCRAAPDLARPGLLLGRPLRQRIRSIHLGLIIGDSSCRQPAPKKRWNWIRNWIWWIRRITGIARGHGTAPGAARRYGTKRPPALCCTNCTARFPIDDDILIVKDKTGENNGVAQNFYDSPLWPKFRFWEHFTWFCNGGERRARNRVLRHLPTTPGLNLLDVAVGDGVYLDWLPRDWQIVGVDISRSQLNACRRRAARPAGLAGPVRGRRAAAGEPAGSMPS